ncbi:unnamed protein product [Effrenium voratum]|uniref:Uncharacterized protein n=1 Tax=Effrenium voratum TaxID=2562239 RepID=A0AA36NFR6_9DINO|nr:unnamed protein product [Effrenium voratum]
MPLIASPINAHGAGMSSLSRRSRRVLGQSFNFLRTFAAASPMLPKLRLVGAGLAKFTTVTSQWLATVLFWARASPSACDASVQLPEARMSNKGKAESQCSAS